MSGSEWTWNKTTSQNSTEVDGSKESFFKRVLRKIFPDQRTEQRIPVPPLVGFLGTARGSRPFEIGDVSMGGFSLVTTERWEPGTEMPITLQRTNVLAEEREDRFTVQATVVRWTEEGVAFSVVLSEEESNAVHDNPLQVSWASRQEMGMFLQRLKDPEELKRAEAERLMASEEAASRGVGFSSAKPALTHSAGD